METEPVIPPVSGCDFSFRRHERLTGPDFQRAQRAGRRKGEKVLTLWAYFRTGTFPRPARLGVVVGRRHGGAVQRNLFKRRVRHAFRTHKPWPRGWDLVVSPKPRSPFPPTYAEIVRDLLAGAEKLGVRQPGPHDGGER